jgi:hypothetical protein
LQSLPNFGGVKILKTIEEEDIIFDDEFLTYKHWQEPQKATAALAHLCSSTHLVRRCHPWLLNSSVLHPIFQALPCISHW